MFPRVWDSKHLITASKGYISCVYSGQDTESDSTNAITNNYKNVWPGYTFGDIMRRAFGANCVAIWLSTLSNVNKDQIMVTGHSRYGKQALLAAAMSDYIKGSAPNAGGTYGENPIRYTTNKYNTETTNSMTNKDWPTYNLRYFVGRESKLPVDMNSLEALIAPNPLIIGIAVNDIGGNPWGVEQAYQTTKKLYNFLGVPDKVLLRAHWGGHNFADADLIAYLDFFDYALGRTSTKPSYPLFYDYTFEKWKQKSGENINPLNYPEKSLNDLLKDDSGKSITTTGAWESKKIKIIEP